MGKSLSFPNYFCLYKMNDLEIVALIRLHKVIFHATSNTIKIKNMV